MRLRPNEPVAGVPARRARDLFRYFRDGIRVEGVADRLGLSEEDAADVLRNFLSRALSNRVTAPRSKKAGMN